MAINLNGTTGITTTGLTSNGIDDNATSTAMTLDTSGNVLVGKTAQNSDNAGVELRAGGQTTATRSASWVGLFNRLTDDGDIVRFQKDSTTVGSIGIESGGLTIDGESGHSGLRFGGSDIAPRDNGVDVDAGIQLGNNIYRFTDLYLSGGVYLGGTGAANKLDDYEEGTWTPAITGITVTSGTFNGTYRKIGGLVSLTMRMENCTLTGSGSTITGLPFTCNLRTSSSGPVTYYHPNGDKPLGILIEGGTSNAYLQYNTTGAWVGAPFTAGPNRYIAVQMTYTTNA